MMPQPQEESHGEAQQGFREGPRQGPDAPRLLDRLRHACRIRHYSIRTEEAYGAWTRRFCRFHADTDGRPRHPDEMGTPEVAAFLAHLATERHVAASTQNQALGRPRLSLRARPGQAPR